MRALLLSPVAAPGGAELIFVDIATGLRDRGHDIKVILLEEGEIGVTLRDRGVDVDVINIDRTRNLPTSIRALIEIRSAVVAHRTDVVLASHSKGHVFARIATLGLSVRRYWRQVLIPQPPSRLDRAASWLKADSVVCNSASTRDAELKITRSPVEIIYPGVDSNRFTPDRTGELRALLGIDETTPLIGLVARFQRWKGHVEFVDTAALIRARYPQAQFVIIGGTLAGLELGFEAEVRQHIRQLGLDDQVHVLGHRAFPEKWMPDLDVLVNASRAEPFGNVVIQAMSCGVPVLAAAAGGPAEIVRPGIDGVLVDSNASEDLAKGLELLLSGNRAEMSLDARARVLQMFSKERMIDAFERLMGQDASP